jgi:hypothetical protein
VRLSGIRALDVVGGVGLLLYPFMKAKLLLLALAFVIGESLWYVFTQVQPIVSTHLATVAVNGDMLDAAEARNVVFFYAYLRLIMLIVYGGATAFVLFSYENKNR